MEFSLLFFSSNEKNTVHQQYQLLREATAFADQHDFKAVWLPERHFHSFGGLYSSPSTLAAALAVTTSKIRLRAGSIVLPLHNPIRVAEEWATVDQLSKGRVDLAFATGWNPNDFVLLPDHYKNRVSLTYEGIRQVKHLWSGGNISLTNGMGEKQAIEIHPQPYQNELDVWLTCVSSKQRFQDAGESGYNILTGLLFQSIDELAGKISLYRQAIKSSTATCSNVKGHVTLMLHSYMDHNNTAVREQVRGPFIEYLKSSVDLWRQESKPLDELSTKEQQILLNFAFERFYREKSLMGNAKVCQSMINELEKIGVDEVACLIDFGMELPAIMNSLAIMSKELLS